MARAVQARGTNNQDSTATLPPPRHGDRRFQEEKEKTHLAGGFFYHLLLWLGKFHPAMVNFPVGLLVAGAIAELLLIFTGRSLFHYATRYCVWLGAISAMVAATLGWFFSAEHPSTWILTVHRWLGTATAAWSLLLLVLTEATYRSGRRGVLFAFRSALLVAALLVVITGFFGGAMVYGIGHYAWPRELGQQEHHDGEAEKAPSVIMTSDFKFQPATVVARLGETVRWKNTSQVAHTVTADPKLAQDPEDVALPSGAAPFNSGIIAPGKTYEHRFTAPGRYRYFCIPHEQKGMIGEVEVKPST